MTRVPVLAYVLAALCPAVHGQEGESQLAKLKKLQLPALAGSVSTLHTPAARQRAITYQKSLDSALQWFEREEGAKVSVVLAVVDEEIFLKLNGPGTWPMPYSVPGDPGLIVFPSRIEELLGPQPEAKLIQGAEYITYHEAGHIISGSLHIWSGNRFVNELIAQMFPSAYLNSRSLQSASPQAEDPQPRYTSLEDLDYVYSGVGFQNYVWFQGQLGRIAEFLVRGQPFRTVIDKLKAEFPAEAAKQETLGEIIAHLDRIRTGAKGMLGPLAAPSSLARLSPSSCPSGNDGGSATSASPVVVAVRNDSSRPLTVAPPQGNSRTIASNNSWSFRVKSGEALKLPDGRCLVAANEPALAVIDKQ